MAWPYSQEMAGREESFSSAARMLSAGQYILLKISLVSENAGSWMTLS